ncbi:MAG TPA: phosphate signaling complex protein PhoU [Acidimicrobiales bacterium]|jgi:phosphate transport system protein|nr:phosphate signaling complex protein PhoU [Acidimicrobiales bacterium]
MVELRRDYHDRLAVLHERVRDIGGIVIEGVRDATRAVLSCDADLAAQVVARDAAIDEVYPWVESEVFDIVARQAPVARDLRFVIATFRIAANIERCGDLVASIARRADRLERGALTPQVRELLEEIGGAVESAFDRAMASYAVLDPDMASTVSGLDVGIDDLQRRLLRAMVSGGASDVESVIDLALVARFYERIGDHGVVIAERVRFVALGEMDAGDRDNDFA